MEKFFKKFLVLTSLLSLLTVSNLVYFAPTAKAQSAWYDQNLGEFYLKVNDPDNEEEIFGERYTAAQVNWVFWGFITFLLNQYPGRASAYCHFAFWSGDQTIIDQFDNVADCVEFRLGLADQNIPDQTLADKSPSVLSTFTNRPISSVTYFQDLAGRLKLVPEAKAQGFGFEAARPVLTVWRAVRNLTYLFLILIIVAMAFMIMFRVKLSPQTVISVQSALPKIVIALILITFSYAIAGLLIDLMYVVIGLIAAIILQIPDLTTDTQWVEIYGELTNQNGVINLLDLYSELFVQALIHALFSGGIILGAIGSTIIIPFLILAVVIIALIFAGFKIIWMFVKTYIQILLLIITAPIQILVGTIAGGGFRSWLVSMASNLAVYPMAGGMFFVAFLFLRAAMSDTALAALLDLVLRSRGLSGVGDFPFGIDQSLFVNSSPWNPPLTVGAGTAIEALWLAASLGTIFLIPKAADIIKGLISGRPFAAYGTAIGTPLMAAGAATTYVPREVAGEIGRGVRKTMSERIQRGIRGSFFRQSDS